MIALTLGRDRRRRRRAAARRRRRRGARWSSTAPVVTDSRECGPGRPLRRRRRRARRRPRLRRRGARRRRGGRAGHPRASTACRASSSTTSRRRSAALARHVVDRRPDLTVVGITGSSGKTEHQGPARPGAAPARRRPCARGSLNNEIGVPLTVLRVDARDRASSSSRWAPAASATSPTSRRIAPPHDRRRAQRRHRPRRRVRLARGDRRGQGRAGRGAARRRASPCSTPTTRVVARHGRAHRAPGCQPFGAGRDADVRAADVAPRRAAAGPSFTLVAPRRGGAASRCALHGEHHVGNALAVAAVALERRAAARPRSSPRWPTRRAGSAAGGWRSPSAPTA